MEEEDIPYGRINEGIAIKRGDRWMMVPEMDYYNRSQEKSMEELHQFNGENGDNNTGIKKDGLRGPGDKNKKSSAAVSMMQ